MATIHLSPGATVMSSPRHLGLERMTEGIGVAARLSVALFEALRRWRAARIDARNDRAVAELAATDPRVGAELRAARDRLAR